ncbi:MAG: hypothetical protein HOP06_06415 [Methylotenera sp.]|nr:hypothetical protein [Methylotenera sp.]
MMLAGKLSIDKVQIEANTATPINLNGIVETPTALFFVSTWCDWYLKGSHPAVSQNCIAAQKQVNKLYKQYPQVNWVGVASRLWTGAPELAEYKKKFNVKHPLEVDSTNSITFEYAVKDYPTLILLNKGKEVFRTQHINSKEISTELKQLTAH